MRKSKTRKQNTTKKNTGFSCQKAEQTEPHLLSFQSHKVRVAMDEQGNPWFVAKDVCNVLEHSNSRQAITELDEDEKVVTKVYTLGGAQELTSISESGLYTLIIRSNKPNARKFRKWVTSKVLPSIRKTGGYTVPKHMYNNVAGLLSQTIHALEGLQVENKTLYPKARCFDLYQNSDAKHGLQATAKILGLKPNTFIKELLADHVLFRRDQWLTAPEVLTKMGWFTTRVFTHPQNPGHQTLVTAKGLVELAKRYGARADLLTIPLHKR